MEHNSYDKFVACAAAGSRGQSETFSHLYTADTGSRSWRARGGGETRMARTWLRAILALSAASLVLSLVTSSVVADDFKGMYWSNSLKPPFTDVDEATGARTLLNWAHGGSVQVKNNFARLTPDKPSKTGWIFNTPQAPRDNWTVLIRFRISGRAEIMSGDGLAFWYLMSDHFNTGMLMGGSDSFIGLGVLFDTYANDELHRDIVVVASDGHDPVLLSSGRRYPGCSSKFRRWEGRDDFDVEQESIAKITFFGTRIVVEIDAKGSGEFVKCVDQDIGKLLPKGDPTWRDRTHFAMSAATGALSDNHDVLEVIVTSTDQFERLMELHDEVADTPPVTIMLENQNVTTEDVGQHVNTLAYEMKDLENRLQKLHHTVEHQVETVRQNLEDLIEKLTQQERKLEMRVAEIEKRLSSDLYMQMDQRLQALEVQIYKNLDGRQQSITKQVASTFNAAQNEARTWRTPFAIFTFLVLTVLGYLIFTVVRINRKVSKEARLYD